MSTHTAARLRPAAGRLAACLHAVGAALLGIVISAGALIALALSYTVGLFGWIEVGLRPPVKIAIASEVGAIVALAGALVASRAGASMRIG